jgi:hypothetical protein
MLSPANVQRMLAAGLGPISVRLRTELAVEAWHWNPRGVWSDPAHQQGYWTSDSHPIPWAPIEVCYGYKLPRRGNTLDEANDDGWSMLDDGDPATFWKSNPYLAQPFTGESDSRHPAWVVLEFPKPVPLNALRIAWADPYAAEFTVEFASGGRPYFGGHPPETWTSFAHGHRVTGTGGTQVVKLADQPIPIRYLRLWMTKSSGTAAPGALDLRDRLGYAIREIGAGTLDASGVFHDEVRHLPGKRQTQAYVSSTDPWHRAVDRDPKVEQPGIDLMFRCGITRSLPVMMAIPVLYDIPENAAALAAYGRARGYPIDRYELGEEPDGQRVNPSDYGALYAQTARALRQVEPHAALGGPSFVTGDRTYMRIPYREWIGDFRRSLAHRGQSGDLSFLSFEWYPFDDVMGAASDQLPINIWSLDAAMRRLRSEHLPLILSEFNYSAFSTANEVDLGGAMLNVETAIRFLTNGGRAAYYYGYEPAKLQRTRKSWGNQTMLLDEGRGAVVPVATYHALRMLTGDCLDPQGGPHEIFDIRSSLGKSWIGYLSSFAVQRPDHSWSVLVINKDPAHGLRLTLAGLPAAQTTSAATLITYSAAQYRWQPDGANGHPALNEPPLRRTVRLDRPISLPAWSIAVLHIDPR